MTTAEEVDEFVATGVDVLAPAFGNVHGEYGPRGPQLDFERSVSVCVYCVFAYANLGPDLRKFVSRQRAASISLSTVLMALSRN